MNYLLEFTSISHEVKSNIYHNVQENHALRIRKPCILIYPPIRLPSTQRCFHDLFHDSTVRDKCQSASNNWKDIENHTNRNFTNGALADPSIRRSFSLFVRLELFDCVYPVVRLILGLDFVDTAVCPRRDEAKEVVFFLHFSSRLIPPCTVCTHCITRWGCRCRCRPFFVHFRADEVARWVKRWLVVKRLCDPEGMLPSRISFLAIVRSTSPSSKFDHQTPFPPCRKP